MIENLSVSEKIINKLLNDSEIYIILNRSNIKVLDKLLFVCDENKIEGKVTNIKIYNSKKEILNYFDYKDFGDFESLTDFIHYYKEIDQFEKLYVYRIKKESVDEIIIKNKEILNLIDLNKKVEQNNIGFSSSKIIKVKLKSGNNAILKINTKSNKKSLKPEYMRMQWLQNKMRCPKIFMWKAEENEEYLLMECLEGQNAYMYNNIGYRLGKELKKIHNIEIENCKFDDYSVENLLMRAKNKLDFALPELLSTYPNETRGTIITFLEENKPNDKVFTHGDYSLPNIIINEKKDQYGFIDLGQSGISTKYLDLFYAIKSFKMNHLENEILNFLKGYGIEELDENIMKWMNIIDKILY